MFTAGVLVFINGLYRGMSGDGGLWRGYLLGGISGLIFHEMAHAAAGLAYGGKIFEFGVMLHYFLPGAYVCIDHDEVKNRFQRVQIHAAGIEMNLFLSGLFMCLSCLEWFNGWTLLYASIYNLVIAVLNSLLIDGLDGMNIFSALLGVEDFVGKSKRLVKSRRKRRKLREKGISGYAVIAVCYFIAIFQMAVPIILFVNIVSLIRILYT